MNLPSTALLVDVIYSIRSMEKKAFPLLIQPVEDAAAINPRGTFFVLSKTF